MNKLFLRNQLCIPVMGYNRAIIYDIIRKDYFFIPNAHYAILDTNDVINFNKITDQEEKAELIDFLLKEEIIFEIADRKQKKRFKSFSRSLDRPNLLTNVIVHSDIDPVFFDFIKDEYLLNVSIIAPQIDDRLFSLLAKIDILEIDSIYLYIENFDQENFETTRQLISNHRLIFSVNFFNVAGQAQTTQLHQNIYFNFFEEEFSIYKTKLTTDKLSLNNEHFLEAYNVHSYYHGKVYIDQEGNVKNGLNNIYSFGKLKMLTKDLFLNTIYSEKFRELGNINKNDTLVCCDCEFRYMCVDSRVPVKGDEKWYHQTECAYNPYLSKWDDEENYINLKDCGVTISSTGCTIDQQKLSYHFNKTWAV
ncbi:hypothetical protein [Pedobacter zeae]|uniref:SPASM domain peptide maturase, grasp-with-spasm system n=2 Tax=Pedobacter zeae TaxID=1737356 RepID=A0A7W6KD86_9SPHI|nr:hypothetical protein [Pedobacter zeae]MBB4109633.1 hypothetical protein [Pedobacter zeae]